MRDPPGFRTFKVNALLGSILLMPGPLAPGKGRRVLYLTCQTSDFHRSDLRVQLDSGAVVIHGERALTARLLDISRSGAALSAPVPPLRDASVTLRLEGLDGPGVAAQVAWTDGPRFGLRFETRLRATDIFLILNRRRATVRA